MATLFYKTKKDSATGTKVQQLIDKGREIEKQIEDYLYELGASRKYVMKSRALFGTGICAVSLPEKSEKNFWKPFPKIKGYYQPRISTAKGKEIQTKLDSFGIVERGDINEVIGYKSFLGNCGLSWKDENYFGFETDSAWKHEMPNDCEEITFTEYQKLFNEK